MGREKILAFRSNDKLLKESIKKTKQSKCKNLYYRDRYGSFGCSYCALGAIQTMDGRRLGNCKNYFEEMFKFIPEHFNCGIVNNEVLNFLLNNSCRQKCRI